MLSHGKKYIEERRIRKAVHCPGSGGGRFGSAVANLGDVNKDGREDIAVGAPGEEGGAGVVYIYLGLERGEDLLISVHSKCSLQIPVRS